MKDYPLAWNRSYECKGQQWRGQFDIEKYAQYLNMEGPVLELGSGDGNTTSQIIKKEGNVICLDIAAASFQVMPMKELAVGKLVGDARLLPMKYNAYTTVLCRHVLTHARQGDEMLILQEISRVLAPGGTVLIEGFTPNDMRHGKGHEVEPDTFLRGDELIWRFYTEEELTGMVEDAGLKILHSDILARTVRHDGVAYRRESLFVISSG